MAAFLPTTGTTENFYGKDPSSANRHVYFYQQDVNNLNSYNLKEDVAVNGTGGFYISDKYAGFHAVTYSTNGTTWTSVGQKNGAYYNNGNSVSFSNNLYIRYDRNLVDFNYHKNNTVETVKTVQVPFGKKLSSYSGEDPGQKVGYFVKTDSDGNYVWYMCGPDAAAWCDAFTGLI